MGAVLLAVCVLFQAFLLPEKAKASELDGVTVRQILTNEQGRPVEAEEDVLSKTFDPGPGAVSIKVLRRGKEKKIS